MGDEESLFVRRYGAWLAVPHTLGDTGRREFFTSAIVVLDTNVLLNLYEFTALARSQVATALEKVAPRLWMPHQVGLEFVSGRHRVINSRTQALTEASATVNKKFGEARSAIAAARRHVQNMLTRYGNDPGALAELDELLGDAAVSTAQREWSDALLTRIKALKNDQDIMPSSVDGADPVIDLVASLYGDRIGAQPSDEVTRMRTEHALTHRFPNRIPPGFADSNKNTPMASAGDYLLWEEILDHVRTLPDPRRVLLVSADTKDDWYQPPEHGRRERPWPLLVNEMRRSAGASLRIETPQDFFEGISRFLDVEIAVATTEEIARAAVQPVTELEEPAAGEKILIHEANATVVEPPPRLLSAACYAARLSTRAIRSTRSKSPHWPFWWWLIDATAELGLREAEPGEPLIDLAAAHLGELPPAPYWEPGSLLQQGEWPYRTSSWIAPWMLHVISRTPEADRVTLLRLAARQLDATSAP
ncbi:PIN-like domain-containing protein [Streptomyces sp. NPDC001930]|uniref:PIN-like domain-containing protein n=1 Tax=Streptomyces sp. NPDC001930 TaxID=3364625 RepID=UPI0036C67CE7